MKTLIWIGIALFVSMVWMRLAPSSVEKWHDAAIPSKSPKLRGHLSTAKISGSVAQTLHNIDAIARATPRTRVLAGRVVEGKITYVTRSLFLGAPDYTTVQVSRGDGGSQLMIYGRLRFGIWDWGVNRYRIKTWLQVLETLTQ